MSNYDLKEYTFEALCLQNKGPKIKTLAYTVGLVDSEKHIAADPDKARYNVLYQLSEAEENMPSPEDLLDWQSQVLPTGYFPQTPVMFVQLWSPIYALLEKGYEPETLRWLGEAPHAVATGIWKPQSFGPAMRIEDCKSDVELFWAIMGEVFKRAHDRKQLVNVIAEVGWSYESMIGGLQVWNAKEIAQSGRVLWKRTWQG